jgi:uncharacterized NAD(P)/FAD-binding protein YdhS
MRNKAIAGPNLHSISRQIGMNSAQPEKMAQLQEFDGDDGDSLVTDSAPERDAGQPVLPVLIVGGGFSGTLLAINLSRLGVPVILFERHQEAVAKGLAYGTRRPEHLLNVRASNMSAFPDDPGHFLRWMGFSGDEQCNRFVPRLAYGQYLREVLIDSLGQTQRRLTFCADHVVDLVESAQGVSALLADGTTVAGRAGVLALGHFPPRLPGFCADLPAPLGWADPWHPEALTGLGPDDRVVLLGTGLTAVDLILSLDKARAGLARALARRARLQAGAHPGRARRGADPHSAGPRRASRLAIGDR